MPTMRAAVITRPGDASVLEIREVPQPQPGPGDVMVRVHASALNRADTLQRMGRYPPPPGAPTDIGGIEYAGEVVQLGDGVTAWRVGDRVFGLADGGTHAEYVRVPAVHVAHFPGPLSFTDAAAIPEAFITAHDALVTQGGMASGDHVLITAVGSGVGTAGAQLARAIGAHGFGTTRSADKLERARALGVEAGLVVGADVAAVTEAVLAWTNGAGVQVAMDLLGGLYATAALRALAARGRLILVGLLAGAEVPFPLDVLLRKRLTMRGTMLRIRSVDEKAAATAAFVRDVVPLIARGDVCPVIDRVVPFAEIADAHRAMEAGEPFGKIVLTW